MSHITVETVVVAPSSGKGLIVAELIYSSFIHLILISCTVMYCKLVKYWLAKMSFIERGIFFPSIISTIQFIADFVWYLQIFRAYRMSRIVLFKLSYAAAMD
jgi:hypothetical protein